MGGGRDKQAADGAQTAATVCLIISRSENTAPPHSDSVAYNEVAMRVCGHFADSIQIGEEGEEGGDKGRKPWERGFFFLLH